jgi:pSer/pThr/pTyr-binding forkhead associated (FHA) protein
LESIKNDKNNTRFIHTIVVENEKTQFRLGRGHDSDLRVNDISVSRCHVILKYHEGKFFLEDQKSKFGTLVLIRDYIKIEADITQAVQVGRSVISPLVKLSEGRNHTTRPVKELS